MPFPTELIVNHTVTFKSEPLVCFTNLPGPDAELTPDQIRLLCVAMLEAAQDCEALLEQARKARRLRRTYSLTEATTERDAAGFPLNTPVFGEHNRFIPVTGKPEPSQADQPCAQGNCACLGCSRTGLASERSLEVAQKTEAHQ